MALDTSTQIHQWLSSLTIAYLCTGNWQILEIQTFQRDIWHQSQGYFSTSVLFSRRAEVACSHFVVEKGVSKFSPSHPLSQSISASTFFFSHNPNMIWLHLFIYLLTWLLSGSLHWNFSSRSGGEEHLFLLRFAWPLGAQCLTRGMH